MKEKQNIFVNNDTYVLHMDIASAIIKADKLKETVFVTFAKAVKEVRTKPDFSKPRFSEELGVSFSTINRNHILNKLSVKSVQNLCRQNGIDFIFNNP